MASLFAFPDAALAGMMKRAVLHLPPQHRKTLLSKLEKGTRDSRVLENAKRFVACLLSARKASDEEFEKDLAEAFPKDSLLIAEKELYLGWLGGRLAMALAETKQGVKGERISQMRLAVDAATMKSKEEKTGENN